MRPIVVFMTRFSKASSFRVFRLEFYGPVHFLSLLYSICVIVVATIVIIIIPFRACSHLRSWLDYRLFINLLVIFNGASSTSNYVVSTRYYINITKLTL